MAHVTAVVGLGFGDEGKGTITEYLVRSSKKPALVVRFNGGAQAGHNVVGPDGRHHTFSQFGSGTLAGAATYLSKFMLVNPTTFEPERRKLGDPPSVFVDEEAVITTPFHVLTNRIRETTRGDGRHGSCGMGIGETMQDSIDRPDLTIRVKDLSDLDEIRSKLTRVRHYKMDRLGPEVEAIRRHSVNSIINNAPARFDDTFLAGLLEQFMSDKLIDRAVAAFGTFRRNITVVNQGWFEEKLKADIHIVMEGAQGVLLDENYGFHPHTTWSTTTLANVDALLAGWTGPRRNLGVLRAYHTRHGAGPFPTESLDSSQDPLMLRGEHNQRETYQQNFRVGPFDAVLARYAIRTAGRLDGLAITCLDRLPPNPIICDRYWHPNLPDLRDLPVPSSIPDQERLTAVLNRYLPLPTEAKRLFEADSLTPEKYAVYLAHHLGQPLHIASFGPTAADKVEF